MSIANQIQLKRVVENDEQLQQVMVSVCVLISKSVLLLIRLLFYSIDEMSSQREVMNRSFLNHYYAWRF